MSNAIRSENDQWENTRQKILDRDGSACRFCEIEDGEHKEETGKGLHIHHIIPQSAGGSDSLNNLIAVCESCHRTLESTQGKAMKRIKKGYDEETVGDVNVSKTPVYVWVVASWGAVHGVFSDFDEATKCGSENADESDLMIVKERVSITPENLLEAVQYSIDRPSFDSSITVSLGDFVEDAHEQ